MSKTLISVTHHSDKAKPHLKRCLDALLRSRLEKDDKIFVSSDASPIVNLPGYEKITFIEDKRLDTTAKKNAAVLASCDVSKFETIILVSDDIVVSSDCISLISNASKSFGAIVSPLTNTELGCNVLTNVVLNGSPPLHLKHRHTIEETDPYLNSLYQLHGPGVIVRANWVSFAIVAIPIRLYADLGGVDPELEYRHNDQYFCMQAATKGVPSLINIEAFALHYGSVTIDNIAGIDGIRQKCSEAFSKKVNY